ASAPAGPTTGAGPVAGCAQPAADQVSDATGAPARPNRRARACYEQRMPRMGSLLIAVAIAACAAAPAADAAAGPDPVLAAAGDIACAPNTPETPTQCHQAETAAIVAGIDPTAVAVLGDNQYETGYLPYYQAVFDGTWGAFKPITYPVPGNHEYYRVGADGYYGYFGAAAGDPTKGYYAYDLGGWHILALNSNCTYVPCSAGSPQDQFVRSELAAHPQSST